MRINVSYDSAQELLENVLLYIEVSRYFRVHPYEYSQDIFVVGFAEYTLHFVLNMNCAFSGVISQKLVDTIHERWLYLEMFCRNIESSCRRVVAVIVVQNFLEIKEL